MATPAKKAKVDSASAAAPKRSCPYGASCYRKNPAHFAEFSHPGDGSSKPDGITAGSSSSSKAASGPVVLPPCIYGAKCYRKNLLHFAEYSHPTVGPVTTPATSTGNNSDGSDTEHYDSDDDTKDSARDKDKDGKDVLNRGMSLVKSFSQMTEAQRKELIQKAFEAKQKLQEELEATKKQVQQKEQELHKLQEEVNKGILLVTGEDEAMKGDTTTYFTLMAERNYKEGSADQIHFRLAESQFYRLLSGEYHSSYRVTKVEYVVTPYLVKRFKDARKNLRKERGDEQSYPVLAFHGTNATNITPICENGFKVPGEAGFHHKTDTGWYGAGVYFSEYPSYSMGYISGATKLLLCQVLPGKVYECSSLIHGAKLQSGFDSHMSPCKKELIIFNSHHILPCYVVHYTSANTEFHYTTFKGVMKKSAKCPKISPDELLKKKKKALKVPKSEVLDGLIVKYVGPKPQETEINNLVAKHKGKKGTNITYHLVVAHEDKNNSNSKVIKTALEDNIPVVTEEYIYECIIQQDDVDKKPYLLDA